MAITTVDIDPDLLRELKASFGIKTSKDAVNFALRDVVMRRRQLAAIEGIAALDLDQNPQRIEYGD